MVRSLYNKSRKLTHAPCRTPHRVSPAVRHIEWVQYTSSTRSVESLVLGMFRQIRCSITPAGWPPTGDVTAQPPTGDVTEQPPQEAVLLPVNYFDNKKLTVRQETSCQSSFITPPETSLRSQPALAGGVRSQRLNHASRSTERSVPFNQDHQSIARDRIESYPFSSKTTVLAVCPRRCAADAHQSGGAPQGNAGADRLLDDTVIGPATTRRAGGSTAAKSRRPGGRCYWLLPQVESLPRSSKWPSSSAAVREEEQV
ncbi:hypothetical protein EVAR_81954_1 [Eumeta japonica]|uniref:Uncharacterized protein n=1 Tax=Eumeta variegata TaxID=151549 RepID=A0A4C1ZHR8_EUMVA|nr:hypothetical protein EVAR_81954_1 [Eumeta japonica]